MTKKKYRMKTAMELEDKCLKNLRSNYIRPTHHSQIHNRVSAASVAGDIALAFHRGYQAGQEELKKYLQLKGN